MWTADGHQPEGADPVEAELADLLTAAAFARRSPPVSDGVAVTALASVKDLVKIFGDVPAVAEVSLEVATGEVVGLLGANGAGKTTRIRCLLGLLTPTRGSVGLFGGPPDRTNLRRVGYVPQSLGLYSDMSIADNLAFRRQVFGGSAGPVDGYLAGELDIAIDRLPLGVQRRAAFTVALSHRPELLVLDEPTSGVGPLSRADLWDTIREAVDRGAGALVTTHHLEEAEQCDRLVMLSGGKVAAAGSLTEVIDHRTALAVVGHRSGPGVGCSRRCRSGGFHRRIEAAAHGHPTNRGGENPGRCRHRGGGGGGDRHPGGGLRGVVDPRKGAAPAPGHPTRERTSSKRPAQPSPRSVTTGPPSAASPPLPRSTRRWWSTTSEGRRISLPPLSSSPSHLTRPSARSSPRRAADRRRSPIVWPRSSSPPGRSLRRVRL